MILNYFLLIAATEPWPTFLPFDVFEKNGFSQFEERTSSQSSLEIVRPSDGATMFVELASGSPQLVQRSVGPGMLVSGRRGWSHGSTPSGYPLGTLVSYFQGGNVTLRGGGHSEHVGVDLVGTGFREGRNRGRRPISVAAESPFLEIALRYSLGHYAARRLTNDGSVSIGNRNYLVMKAAGTNTRYIDLAAWAHNNDLVVGSGQDGTVKSFTKGGQLWIIPLASVKIKKGSTWQTLPDLVMRKDGKFYIPVAALQ